MKAYELIEVLKSFDQDAEVEIRIIHAIDQIYYGKIDHIVSTTYPIKVIITSDSSSVKS